ncbi:hypothetical protein M1523_01385 [Patescibacteria group bacterium]|nr:hypothetical protein [Patescibacteria group bacterium]MCL5091567.1 hypothetical protein [Patescibacteria group bacterium]
MNSREYTIQAPNVNIGGSNRSQGTANYKLSTTLGQLAAGEFQSNGYIVKAGFQYIDSIIPFTFSISKTNIDFQTLVAYTPKTDSAVISVSFGSAGQYTVTAISETPFNNFSGSGTIAATACDPSYSCTTSTANLWSSDTTTGFGYNMEGQDLPTDFTSCEALHGVNQCYRPFPDRSVSNNPEIIMTSTNVTLNITPTPNPTVIPNPTGTPRDIVHQSTITFKVNIPDTQAGGNYGTVINFVATPGY